MPVPATLDLFSPSPSGMAENDQVLCGWPSDAGDNSLRSASWVLVVVLMVPTLIGAHVPPALFAR